MNMFLLCAPSSDQTWLYTFYVAVLGDMQPCFLCVFPAEFITPRAILTGHDCEVTCVSVCAELGLVISGCKGKTRVFGLSSWGCN